jgi:ZIP family zinc transporter
MIHNIPEGIAIAIPCLAARPDQPWLSFVLASVSGLAEPLGAFVALLFLRGMGGNTSSDATTGDIVVTASDWISLENVLSLVAGVMVTVALWELFPEALRHSVEGKKKKTHFWYGTFLGLFIMCLTEMYLPNS